MSEGVYTMNIGAADMGTSMNDIASKLGVTKAALYKHYKSKQEIADLETEKNAIEEALCSGTLSVDELTEK